MRKRVYHRLGRRCDGMLRRDCVRIGTLAALGVGFGQWFPLRAHSQTIAARAKSCILIWMDGGPSHLETFDLKPDAPADVRGPFRPINTKVSGLQLCELMPRTAAIADKITIIRSMTSPLGEHGLANHYLMTGYHPSAALQYPSYGSVLSRMRQGNSELPESVAVPESRSNDAGYLGAAYEPFATGGDPSKPDFRVRDVDFFPGIDESRIYRRREFLKELDAKQEQLATLAESNDSPFEQAYRLLVSPAAKDAFKLEAEPEQRRALYGPRMIGQSCLLARRLVERGVPFVTVHNSGWDTHENLALQLRDGFSGAKVGVGLIPNFDQAFAALVSDLSDRGLLDETLVIAMGEFGRTPKLNTRGGRDHWPRVFSVALAGAGIAGGQVIGSSDRVGESPLDRPVTPNDLARTIYTLLGIDPDYQLVTPDGRPVAINQGGTIISELV